MDNKARGCMGKFSGNPQISYLSKGIIINGAIGGWGGFLVCFGFLFSVCFLPSGSGIV